MTDLPLPIEPDPHSAPGETKYIHKNGASVRVFATDGGGIAPIIGAFWSELSDTWQAHNFSPEYLRLRPQPKREPREWWVNEYAWNLSFPFETREEADAAAAPNRLACIHVREVLDD